MMLDWIPVEERLDLVAEPVARAVSDVGGVRVAEIDPALADTAAFCEKYGVALEDSANCVVVAGKRAGETRHAAVMVLATHRADVNGAIRRHLGVRKISFAPHDDAVVLTGMEYGGITPIGLPPEWPVLVDETVTQRDFVVIGSGLRRSKLALSGRALASIKNAEVLSLVL